MDYNILCESLKELYGKNNDYGLFRADMTEAEKSNLLRNFDGGAAFGNLKGFIPFSGYDLYTTSKSAFKNILREMKPWHSLNYDQKKQLVVFSEEKRQLNTDEGRLVADYVLGSCPEFMDLAIEADDDGLPMQTSRGWLNKHYTVEDAAPCQKAFEEFKDRFFAYTDENEDNTQSTTEVSAQKSKVLEKLGEQSAATIGVAAVAMDAVAQNAEEQNNNALKTLGEQSAPIIAASAEAMNKFAQEAASTSKE